VTVNSFVTLDGVFPGPVNELVDWQVIFKSTDTPLSALFEVCTPKVKVDPLKVSPSPKGTG